MTLRQTIIVSMTMRHTFNKALHKALHIEIQWSRASMPTLPTQLLLMWACCVCIRCG